MGTDERVGFCHSFGNSIGLSLSFDALKSTCLYTRTQKNVQCIARSANSVNVRQHHVSRKSYVIVASSSSDSFIQKQGSSMEDVDDRVVDTIQRLKSPRVSISDVSVAGGMSLSQVEPELVKLAALVGATLEVSNDGDILYEFPKNVKGALYSASQKRRIRELIQKIAPGIAYVARVSFGIALFVSIAVVFAAITVLISSSSNQRDDDRRRGNSGTIMFSPGYNMFGPSWYDLFWYDTYYSRRRVYEIERNERKMSFLEAVFSFVFGDADTFEDLDETRWKNVARIIRNSNGAVVAEQLRPLLDPVEDDALDSDVIVSEKFMLPVLTRFSGHPEVTEDGEIVYVFPELQKTASQVEFVGAATNGIQEKSSIFIEPLKKFSIASFGQKLGAGILGAINFFGVLKLGSLLSDPRILSSPSAVELARAISGFYPALLVYASAFALIPLFRLLLLQLKNSKIESRNQWRQQGHAVLSSALSSQPAQDQMPLRNKLLSARKFAQSRKVLKRENSFYRSDETVDTSSSDLSDFDRKLFNRS
mmetsp:Transcript_248/g.432  ORF Transcript_248/g.432 Transcript_248/m.432 type:complete len:535 (-) Transcript_248:643-2247(-)